MCYHTAVFLYSHCWHLGDAPKAGPGYIPPVKCARVIEELERYHGIRDTKPVVRSSIGQSPHWPTLHSSLAPCGDMDTSSMWNYTVPGSFGPTAPFSPPPDVFFNAGSTPQALPLHLPSTSLPTPPSQPPSPHPHFPSPHRKQAHHSTKSSGNGPPRPPTPALCPKIYGTRSCLGNVHVRLIPWWCTACQEQLPATVWAALEKETRSSGRWQFVKRLLWRGVVATDSVDDGEQEHMDEQQQNCSDGAVAQRAEEVGQREKLRRAGAEGPPIVGKSGDADITGAWWVDWDGGEEVRQAREQAALAHKAGWKAWEMLGWDDRCQVAGS